MTKAYQKIIISILALSLIGLLEKSSSRQPSWEQSFTGWFLELLQIDKQKNKNKPIQESLVSNFFETTSGKSRELCEPKSTEPDFLVVGGGGSPKSNEIALEKNILYFQRTLKNMGINQPSTTV
ncbi:MAG: Caspase domain-containing protein, partial [Cyanobacteria bacterium P01_G01_bin.49]